MAKSGKHALHTINALSYGILAVLFMVVDIIAAKTIGNPVETLVLTFSGALFGMGLGAVVSGRDSGNRLISTLVLIAYVALLVFSYWFKLVNL